MTEAPITLEEIDEHEAYAKQEIERFGAGGLVELDPREILRLCAAARRGVEADARISETLSHSRNCPVLAGRDDACTCGLIFRQQTQTAENVSAAWRQRAETAEAALAAANSTLLKTCKENIALLNDAQLRRGDVAETVRRERDIAEALSKSLLALGWVQNHPDFGPFANRIHEAVADAIQAVEREIDAIRARPTEPAASPAAPIGESE